MLVLYTDDFLFSGNGVIARMAFLESHSLFGFDPETVNDPQLRSMIGMNVSRPLRDGTAVRLFLHQCEYIENICTLFAEEFGLSGPHQLKTISTPCKPREDATDAQRRKVKGRFGPTAPRHIGRTLWVSRGTRLDVTMTVNRVSRRQSSWSACEDDMLHRLYRYLWTTRKIGLWFVIDASDIGCLRHLLYVDADHNNDHAVTQRSTSGHVLFVGANSSRCALNWGAGAQGATSRNTAEAEIVGIADGVFNSSAAMETLWEQLTGVAPQHITYSDNDAARIAVVKGVSRKLSYVRRHQRVSIDSLYEYHKKDGRQIKRVDSKKNTSDIFTKPLDHLLHWRCCRELGLGPPPP